MTMTRPPHYHVPGAFDVDGAHPNLFRPPTSTVSGSTYNNGASSSPQRRTPQQKRRRTRDHAEKDASSTNKVNTPARSQLETTDVDMSLDSLDDERRYILAGQLDTPGPGNGNPEHGILGESVHSDSDFRRLLGSKRRHDQLDIDGGATSNPGADPTPLFNLPPQPTSSQPGWGSFAFTAIGGVVGRVWDFCRTGAFKGFHAGGGSGFDLNAEGTVTQRIEEDERRRRPRNSAEYWEQHRIPGNFPHHSFEDAPEEPILREDQHDDDEEEARSRVLTTPTQPSAKRRQTDRADELGRNWVMVSEPGNESGMQRRPSLYRSSTPRNRNHGPSMATGRRISTPSSRPSTGPQRRSSTRIPQPSSPARTEYHPTTSSASFASPRPSTPSKPAPTTTPKSTSQHRRHQSATQHSYSQPTRLSRTTHRRSNSGASTASNRAAERITRAPATAADDEVPPDEIEASPRLTPEARQLAQRRRNEERDADVRMAAFNKRLQDMIRQGKEALGTTVEVDGANGAWEDE